MRSNATEVAQRVLAVSYIVDNRRKGKDCVKDCRKAEEGRYSSLVEVIGGVEEEVDGLALVGKVNAQRYEKDQDSKDKKNRAYRLSPALDFSSQASACDLG